MLLVLNREQIAWAHPQFFQYISPKTLVEKKLFFSTKKKQEWAERTLLFFFSTKLPTFFRISKTLRP